MTGRANLDSIIESMLNQAMVRLSGPKQRPVRYIPWPSRTRAGGRIKENLTKPLVVLGPMPFEAAKKPKSPIVFQPKEIEVPQLGGASYPFLRGKKKK